MIFVTVGTWHRGFDRLLRGIHECLERGIIKESVYAQIGHGNFRSLLMENVEFLSASEFVDCVNRCRVVVAHAGVGSIYHALEARKPIIVVPRKAALGEADNDHQFATARQFAAEGRLLVAYEVDELPQKLEEAQSFVPAPIATNECLLEEVGRFLEQVALEKALKRRKA